MLVSLKAYPRVAEKVPSRVDLSVVLSVDELVI